MARSIAAVVGGFLLTVVLAFGMEFILMVLFHREPVNDYDRESTMLVILLLTTSASAATGGYFAGWIAIRRPLTHAVVLGVLGLLATIPATVAAWNREPAWYHVGTLAFLLPATALGGWLRAREQAVA